VAVSEQTQTAVAPATNVIQVAPGGSFDLRVGRLDKRIGDAELPLLAYNGTIPGPTLRVKQGSQIRVDVVNDTDMETTVHWHGLRLANAYDGVPHETQTPIPPGGRYSHLLTFPDAGLYWYHPHIREDYAQELGLYGNVIVEPADPSYWPPVDTEVVWTLDDILVEDGAVAPFFEGEANHAAMGRYGNVLLIGGELQQTLTVGRGDVVRLHLTNTANTRVFNVTLPGARMKLVGGDAGRYEHETWVDSVVIAPSERAVVDVRFASAGRFVLQHATPGRTAALAEITVTDGAGSSPGSAAFDALRTNAEMVTQRRRASAYLAADPDKTLALVAVMDVAEPDTAEAVSYVCPMHPEVVRDVPGKCPLCGMKLLPTAQSSAVEHQDHEQPHHHDAPVPTDGIEWEDLMPEVNRATTSSTMHWKLVDRETGAENSAIRWVFEAGEQVKVRLVNEMDSDHPMHHPFHVHGERFLVLSRDGRPEPNLVWKDTVLVRTGETVDLLLDASNPGVWMAHCHIAEHMESGMMFTFRVKGP
jgi:FtsP/CotA-like multicopper oxidase with cupredoxin domain